MLLACLIRDNRMPWCYVYNRTFLLCLIYLGFKPLQPFVVCADEAAL